MADKKTAKDILRGALGEGAVLDRAMVRDVFAPNTSYPTDEIAERAVLQKYRDIPLLKDRADELSNWENVTMPDYEAIFNVLKIKADEGTEMKDQYGARMRKFLDGFKDNLEKWRDRARDAWGDMGWETVKKAWQRASIDDMNRKISEARAKDMESAPLDYYGLFQVKDPFPKATAWLASMAAPRIVEDVRENGDWRAKDALLDATEGLLYAVPGSGWTALGGKALSMVPGLSRAGRGIGSILGRNQGLYTAGSILKNAAGTVAGNTAAPLASEVLDATVYDDEDRMDQRKDFSVGDVATGAAVNTAINRQLFTSIADWIRRTSTKPRVDRAAMQRAANVIEDLGNSSAEKGNAFAEQVRKSVEPGQVTVVEPGEVATPVVDAYRYGRNPAAEEARVLTSDQYDKAQRMKDILDAIDNGEIRLTPQSDIKNIKDAKLDRIRSDKILSGTIDTGDITKVPGVPDEVLDGILVDMNKKARFNELIEKPGQLTPKESEEYNKIVDEVKARYIKDVTSRKYAEQVSRDLPIQDPGIPRADVFTVDWRNSGLSTETGRPVPADRVVTASGIPVDEARSVLDANLPEYVNYAMWHGKGAGSAGVRAKAGEIAKEALVSEVKNKLGRTETAKNVLGSALDSVKKDQEETRAAPRKRRASSQAGKVLDGSLGGGTLTGEDREFIEAIRKNPDVVKFGLKSGDQDKDSRFRLWLISGGNDILREYIPDAYRPSWEVK